MRMDSSYFETTQVAKTARGCYGNEACNLRHARFSRRDDQKLTFEMEIRLAYPSQTLLLLLLMNPTTRDCVPRSLDIVARPI